jgi:hypothetical protein
MSSQPHAHAACLESETVEVKHTKFTCYRRLACRAGMFQKRAALMGCEVLGIGDIRTHYVPNVGTLMAVMTRFEAVRGLFIGSIMRVGVSGDLAERVRGGGVAPRFQDRRPKPN